MRRNLYRDLASKGISPQVHYIPVPRQPWYRQNVGTDPTDFPGALAYYASCLSLPLFPAMKDEDVTFVLESIEVALVKQRQELLREERNP